MRARWNCRLADTYLASDIKPIYVHWQEVQLVFRDLASCIISMLFAGSDRKTCVE
jgi:hypothetical protein